MTNFPEIDLPEDLKIGKLIEKMKFASNDMYFYEGIHGRNPVKFFIKIYKKDKDISANEGPILDALSDSGIPVPHLYAWSSRDPAYLAVGEIEGSPAPNLLSEIDEKIKEEASNDFARQIGESLGILQLEWGD